MVAGAGPIPYYVTNMILIESYKANLTIRHCLEYMQMVLSWFGW